MLTRRPTAQLRSRLAAFIVAKNAEELREYLRSLRNTEHRAASVVLAEAATWQGLSEEEFWNFFLVLATDNAKAYLGTLLKAVIALHHHIPMRFCNEALDHFAKNVASDIDRRKTLDALLPLLSNTAEIKRILTLFGLPEKEERIRAGFLFRAGTPSSYFLLFRILQRWEDEPQTLRRFAIELIRKGDKTSFNMACIVREYFNLEALPGTFSLNLPPYELSRLDTHFKAFSQILLR